MKADVVEWSKNYDPSEKAVVELAKKSRERPLKIIKFGRELLKNAKSKGGNFLEVGCGSGAVSYRLALVKPRNNFHLLDYSPAAIKTARKLFKHAFGRKVKAKFVCADMLELPFGHESMDLVYGNTSIEHVKDTGTLLREVFRVLKPGGHAVFTVPNKWRPDGTWLWEKAYGYEYYTKTFSIPELKEHLAKAGFKTRGFFGATIFFTTPFVLARVTGIDWLYRKLARRSLKSLKKKRTKSAVTATNTSWKKLLRKVNDFVDNNLPLPPHVFITIGFDAVKPGKGVKE